MMARAAQRIAALEQQMADLAAEVTRLHQQALIIRTLDETALMHAGYSPDAVGLALEHAFDEGRASAFGGTAPRPGARHPRHLQVVRSAP